MTNLSKEYVDNYKVEVFFRYKKKLVFIQNEKEEVEKQISKIVDRFIIKTGMDVKSVKIEKDKDKYKLLLEV